mgnify:CR=1 FL=1|jgi:DNA anti-recombination protein RmuC
MFRRLVKRSTEHTQNIDNDEVIESKIKECQRENGRCMVSTSNRLRKKFGDEKVNRILSRLSQRRYRGNQYQKQESDEITRFIDKLFKNYDLI